MVDHDASPGTLQHCQICGSENLRLVIDLGHQPPCDSLLTKEQLNEPEITYPLRLNQCEECSLTQLDYVVPATKVYPADYPYRAGISWPIVAAHKEMAAQIIQRFEKGFCVDIGSNDGTLLAQFKAKGCSVLGVEPTNVGHFAIQAGVPTIQSFFCETVALNIVKEYSKAHIVTLTNVFAHMGDLGEVMRGISALLAKDGFLIIENHYLLDILERNQFDSIYHEHIRTYTLKSLICLFRQYDMEIFDVERVPRYGGNIRVYVAWKGRRTIQPQVSALLALEEKSGTYSTKIWSDFHTRIIRERDLFMEFICGRQVVGCSAPGRASTLLNFYGIDTNQIPWTGEVKGSLKIGKYLPGCHIPVVSNERIVKEQPEHLVLLAWHYGEQIRQRLKEEGVKSKLITPLPVFAEIRV